MFTTEVVYNGRKAKFNVYSTKVESITPKFNLETGQQNEEHTVTLTDGSEYSFFTEATTEKNGLKVIIEAKKHHREQYIEAVQSQLLYFNNVKLTVHSANGNSEDEEVAAKILYEDDKIVISDNEYYSKPHIIVNRVNYGYINFDELELEQKVGNIGIKVSPEEVEISPNRESLIWNDITKETILKRFHECTGIATKLIQAELNEPDFINWLRVCTHISGRIWGKDSVLSRLANIIDTQSLSPKFGDTKIKFTHDVLNPVNARFVSFLQKKKANQETIKVSRDPITFLGSSIHLPIIIGNDKANNRKDKYILQKLYTDGFILVQKRTLGDITRELDEKSKLMDIDAYLEIADLTFELLSKSKSAIEYDSIVVPDSFTGTDEDEDILEEVVEQVQAAALSHEERRKLEGKTVLFTPRNKSDLYKQSRYYEWHKVELPIKEINDWDSEEIYYATDKTAEMMEFVALLTRNTTYEEFRFPREEPIHYNSRFDPGYGADERYRCSHYYKNPNIKLIKVSEANSKLYRDFYPITDFFLKFKNNKLTMSNILVKWNTARRILPSLNKIAFLYNYPLDLEKRDLYHQLVDYVRNNYREVLDFKSKDNNIESAHNDLVSHLDKVMDFQLFLATSPSTEEVQQVAQDLWGNPNVSEATAIDYDLWDKFQKLLEWAIPVGALLNQVVPLTGVDYSELTTPYSYLQRTKDVPLSEELEKEIHWYSKHKNVI